MFDCALLFNPTIPIRLSRAAAEGWYTWLDDMYSSPDLATFNYSRYNVSDISIEEIHKRTSHRKKDMIIRQVGGIKGFFFADLSNVRDSLNM